MSKVFTKLIRQSSLTTITVTENGVYKSNETGFSKVTVAVPRPQLNAPTLTLDGDILTITPNADNGAFESSYDLYINDTFVANYTSTTIDLKALDFDGDAYMITVKAKGENFIDSVASLGVAYITASVPETSILFSSLNSFTLGIYNKSKGWEGTLEYSTDNATWNTWDGATKISADNGKLYMRGTGNTAICPDTGFTSPDRWQLTGKYIFCLGNIENLLDYATVANGEHPTMASYCYKGLFYYCDNLVTAPELPATTLTDYCYMHMFYGCKSLIVAPELPATTLAYACYHSMFSGCTSLTTAPELPATTLTDYCYNHMFNGCSKLTTAPELPATTLTGGCYNSMFSYCRSLIVAPELPATTLAGQCYYQMFNNCTSLTTAPELPATTLAGGCYFWMFYNCTSLTTAPELPATTLAGDCYQYMFYDCTSLTTAPELPATTLASGCYDRMFYGCTSLTAVPELPARTLAFRCYRYMFNGCTNIKLSAVQTDEYATAYRIPTSGTGTTDTDALKDMFTGTGGTFTGTPSINTTYYLHSSNSVV